LTGNDKYVLVVEDDERVRSALEQLLQMWGYEVTVAKEGAEGWEKIIARHPMVVLSDLQMPGLGGMELLRRARDLDRGIAFVILTGHGTIPNAVEAIRLGALNFLQKPIDPGCLENELRNCVDRRRPLAGPASAGLAGTSPEINKVKSLIGLIAPSSASVLITGESGTGKEVAARSIHQLSNRRRGPFVAVNCAAIPETLIESELFGYEKGAFTGAQELRAGCFELARGGTLLLDEIGDMPVSAQTKLLRVLEDSKVRRLGAKSEINIDVRVLASTNKSPEEAIKSGQLRSDLFYRLNVVRIEMPPLRDHLADLDDLVVAILQDVSRKNGGVLRAVHESGMELFRRYSWPGNVRELRNALEHAVVSCRGDVIQVHDLPAMIRGVREEDSNEIPRIRAGLSIAEVERKLILETVRCVRNKTRAAEILGITSRTLHNKLREYGTPKPQPATLLDNM
jgi:DNA-binding NtrC family response regulator